MSVDCEHPSGVCLRGNLLSKCRTMATKTVQSEEELNFTHH